VSKVKKLYWLIWSFFFYRPYCIQMGRSVFIYRPILISPRCLKFGSKILIRDFARLEGIEIYQQERFKPVIEIGDHVVIEQNLHLTCAQKIQIGKNTAIAANVTITDINHPYKNIDLPPELQPIEVNEVHIGEDCKIYNNAVILPGTTLGKHCVVGANSVVTGRNYLPYSIIVGAPAIVVKRYSFDTNEWLKTTPNGEFIK